MSIAKKINQKIERLPMGKTFTYADLDISKTEYVTSAKALERLVKKEIIKKYSKGIFYKPEKTVFGELLPKEQDILNSYLYENGKRVAYITGIALYNSYGLTTQISKQYQVASRNKRIFISKGNLKVTPVKSYVDVANENYKVLELLDLIKDFTKIPDLDKEQGIRILENEIRKLDKKLFKLLIQYALKYPPRCRALLGAILEELGKPNTIKLKESLNTFTSYKLNLSKVLSTTNNWQIT